MATSLVARRSAAPLRCWYSSRRCLASLVGSHFKPLIAQDVSPKQQYEIAGRKWLPGSGGPGFPKYLNKAKDGFPYVLEVLHGNKHSITEWAKISSEVINMNLPKYGTMVLRGLPLTSDEDFGEFAKSLPYTSMSYPSGGAADRSLHDDKALVYTASNEPPEFTIELHNELGYLAGDPVRKLIFYCAKAPAEGCGGFTVICDSKEFMMRLDPNIIKKLEEKDVTYINTLPDQSKSTYMSWQRTFNTEDMKEAQKYLEKGGYGFSCDEENSTLTFWNTLPVFRTHPDTGEKMWFSSVHISHISGLLESPMFPGEDKMHTVYTWNTTYGDGSPIEPEVIQHIRACMWNSTYAFQWHTGDLLVVDNFAALHGRLSFTGERKVLARLMAD